MAQAEIQAGYESFPVGYYGGPRPGKSRYTKDDYLWMVTPEFGAAYCMPTEFVDATLKGAEAVAYKLVYEGLENCGFGGNRELRCLFCNHHSASSPTGIGRTFQESHCREWAHSRCPPMTAAW